ncbi:MAG: response regulator transcription factor [Planctomycetaceae bacterium]
MQSRILLIEDERDLAETLMFQLQKMNYLVFWEPDGPEGLEFAQVALPDLVILDLILPKLDGLQVCRRLKSDSRTSSIPVMILTARDSETDEIVSFSMGADDFVKKPFRIQPLLLRIQALLRKTESANPANRILSAFGLTVDRVLHTVTYREQPLELTPTEFRLLWTLMSQPGRPFSRLELIEVSRGQDAAALERTIDVHVRSLRSKLKGAGVLIETVRGIGYRFVRE